MFLSHYLQCSEALYVHVINTLGSRNSQAFKFFMGYYMFQDGFLQKELGILNSFLWVLQLQLYSVHVSEKKPLYYGCLMQNTFWKLETEDANGLVVSHNTDTLVLSVGFPIPVLLLLKNSFHLSTKFFFHTHFLLIT